MFNFRFGSEFGVHVRLAFTFLEADLQVRSPACENPSESAAVSDQLGAFETRRFRRARNKCLLNVNAATTSRDLRSVSRAENGLPRVVVSPVVQTPRLRYRRCYRGRVRRNDLDRRDRPHTRSRVPRSLRFAAPARAAHATQTRSPHQTRCATLNGRSIALIATLPERVGGSTLPGGCRRVARHRQGRATVRQVPRRSNGHAGR